MTGIEDDDHIKDNNDDYKEYKNKMKTGMDMEMEYKDTKEKETQGVGVSEPAYEIVKRKTRKWPLVFGIVLAGAVAAIAIPVIIMQTRTVKLSEFVNVEYNGISGYASPHGVIDNEKLYNSLAGEEKDVEKLETYKNFADSVSASVSGSKVSNGDSLEIKVTYDDELRKNTGYKVSEESFTITAEGIDPGKSVNLFEDASINITGISPDAVLDIENRSSDEYLGKLTFSSDKEKVANGDNVTIKCDVTDEELAEHGFTTSSLSAAYDVKGLSEYIKAADIDKSLVDIIAEEDKKFIESETADDKFRMLYKLTDNAEYLSVPNTEKAEGTVLEQLYLLKKKEGVKDNNSPENIIVAVLRSDITAKDKKETGYFAFLFPNSYVTAEGETEVNFDEAKASYELNTDKNVLLEKTVKVREGDYDITEIDLSSFEKPAEMESSAAEETPAQSEDPAEETQETKAE